MKTDCIINESKFLLTPETYTQEQWHKMFGILKEKFLLLHEENNRLNNIINEFDKWLIGEQMMFYKSDDGERLIRYAETTSKWLELKEGK